MASALQGDERRAVEALLRFANLPRIQSELAVERCFHGLIDFREFQPDPIHPDPARMRGQFYVDLVPAYARVHRVARAWLTLMATSVTGRRKVWGRVSAHLKESVIAKPQFDDGRLKMAYEFGNSVEAACAFGAAVVLDESRNRGRSLASRLKRCGWSECGRFNLDLNPKGRPRRFCSAEHKRRADLETVAERVRKYRESKP